MVRFSSEFPINDPLEDANVKNFKDSFEIVDAQANDFLLADSFLDFDSIEDYFEDKPAADMVAEENNNFGVEDKSNQKVKDECSVETTILDQQIFNGSEPVIGSTCVVKMDKTESGILRSSSPSIEEVIKNVSAPVEIEFTRLVKMEPGECESLGTFSSTIQEGLEKISLVGDSQSLVRTDGHEISGSESADSSSPSSSSSYHTNSSSDSGSSSRSSSTTSDDDDDDNEEEEKGEEKTEDIDVEIEEGEIRDSGGEDLVTETTAAADDDSDDDEDDSGHATKGHFRSKNEPETLPPVPLVDVTLQPQHQLLAVGIVMSIIGAKVIVEGVEKHDPLNEGSILWISESRRALGFIDEIFGPVKNPYYVVRYNSENEVPEGIHGGTLISFVPEFANLVLNNKDIYKKGYDASGADDEMSDEEEFSDDEKEAEFQRTHRMTKRGINDQNPRKGRNNRKKAPQKEGEVPIHPVRPATTLFAHGNCSTFLGSGQGILRETTLVPPFQAPSACLNPPTNGVWTNCTTFLQPQSSVLPNALATNGMSWFQENTQNCYQLPAPGIPFQQQSNPNEASLSINMMPGMSPNIYPQPMFAPGVVNQNQLTFGLSSHLPQMQRPLCTEQGFLSNEWSERNTNFHFGNNRGRPPAPHQFHRGTSANRGRRAFHRRCRNGWRPAN